ncbi:uncharacterized protein TNCV_3797511 [Trichonephila clavipes]|nr:uncharacterized protein TNCV_3797511 [Trichonephila clavipes]
MIHLKRQLGANQFARLCAHEPIADAAVDGLPVLGSCIKTPLHAIRGAADVNEVGISTPVAVDQRVANYLEETVRSFTAMRSKCRSSRADITFRRPLPVLRVVRCSLVHCLQTCITVELFHCTRAPIAR